MPGKGSTAPCHTLRRGHTRDTAPVGCHLPEGMYTVLAIIAAVLFLIAWLINAAEVSTNDVFTSTNVMLIGLALVALHVAGVGSGWAARGRRR